MLSAATLEMTDEIPGNRDTCVGFARSELRANEADTGRFPSPSKDEMADTGAPVAIGIATRVVEGIRESVRAGTLVTPPSNSDTADEAALGRAEFPTSDDNTDEASGKIVAWVGAARIEDTMDTALLGRPVFETTSDDRTDPTAPLGT